MSWRMARKFDFGDRRGRRGDGDVRCGSSSANVVTVSVSPARSLWSPGRCKLHGDGRRIHDANGCVDVHLSVYPVADDGQSNPSKFRNRCRALRGVGEGGSSGRGRQVRQMARTY